MRHIFGIRRQRGETGFNPFFAPNNRITNIDLVNARREKKITDIAIVRLEQLYPFPKESLEKELSKYPKATEIVWAQEEPRNQGAWYWIASRHHLDSQISGKQKMLLVSRPFGQRREKRFSVKCHGRPQLQPRIAFASANTASKASRVRRPVRQL